MDGKKIKKLVIALILVIQAVVLVEKVMGLKNKEVEA